MHDKAKFPSWRSARGLRPLAAIIGLTIGLLGATACNAQCVEMSDRVPPLVVQTFASEPGSLLRDLRNDKEKLAGRLTGYLITDISLLPAVRTLVSEAPNADRAAIGAALRLAEMRCLPTKPEAARKINDFVRKLGDNAVLSGYSVEVEAATEPPPPLRGGTVAPNVGLMTGEWSTEPADPFASIPLPQ